MTLPEHDTVLFQLYDLLASHGFDGLADALTVLLNEVMKIERSQHLQAQLYERTDNRLGYANGYKPKTVKTRVGELTVAVPLSEQEVHWRRFLQQLKQRGLHGVQLIVSDAHEGLKAAKQAVFPAVPWQRCQTHLQRNAFKYVPRKAMKAAVAADIRAIFRAPDRSEADRLSEKFIARYAEYAPTLTDWAETALPQGLTVFAFDRRHRRRLRTTNVLERLHQEIRRRTRVATLFPNEASCLRLVTAVVMEISDEWVTNKTYRTLEAD